MGGLNKRGRNPSRRQGPSIVDSRTDQIHCGLQYRPVTEKRNSVCEDFTGVDYAVTVSFTSNRRDTEPEVNQEN